MISVSIIGSCACRDLFEKDNGNYEFRTDIRFQSPYSIIQKPNESILAERKHFIKNVPVVNGNWYRKILLYDLNKTVFKELLNNHGDYLITDLCEARYKIAEIKLTNLTNLKVTNCPSFKKHYEASFKHNVLRDSILTIIDPLEIPFSEWDQIIKEYSDNLKKIFKEENIILIKNMPAKYFVDSQGLLKPYYSDFHCREIYLCNLLMPHLYSEFIKCCPKCKIIEIPKFAVGSKTHKWGNHPFHFNETYYDYLLKSINEMIMDNGAKSKEIFDEYSKVFENEFKKFEFSSIYCNSYSQDEIFDTLFFNNEEFRTLGRKKQFLMLFIYNKNMFFRHWRKIIRK